jgi:hypothetical protein
VPQEINALETLVGKIMPVYFPDLLYRENGCEVVELGDPYAVISEDGSGVGDNAHRNRITLEVQLILVILSPGRLVHNAVVAL